MDTSLSVEPVIRLVEQVVSWQGNPKRFGSTRARNSLPNGSSPGVRNGQFSCRTSTRTSQIRILLSRIGANQIFRTLCAQS